MHNFDLAYKKLNPEQKEAVEKIFGPLLVVAGPGTGKTHLLSLRTANILKTTDVLPSNFLCLTFSDSATTELRNRLIETIGKAAYEAKISTYHGFGSDIIQQYPQYFPTLALHRPIDELDTYEIIENILKKLPFSNPIRVYADFPGEVIGLISKLKSALVSPEMLSKIANSNLEFVKEISEKTKKELKSVTRIDKISRALFEKLIEVKHPNELTRTFVHELAEALSNTENTKDLTSWKNKWLEKDKNGQFVVKGKSQNEKLIYLSKVYEAYENELSKRKLFDYDDMIQHLLRGLTDHEALRYTLQEQFQFIMLDEFQDTNISQLEIVRLLGDNPVHEGQPNIMAVGDDDQAIYTFQGANYSHMLKFHEFFKKTKIITLKRNYRSTQDIIDLSTSVANQLDNRLSKHVDIDKTLKSANQHKSNIKEIEYITDVSEFAGVTKFVQKLIKSNVNPKDIAIIAPKHKYLEEMSQYLKQESIPVRYERKENLLDKPVIVDLVESLRLIDALSKGDFKLADSLFAKVLSQGHYNFEISKIWKFSWKAKRLHRHWSDLIIDDPFFSGIGSFFIELSLKSQKLVVEEIVEYLIGRKELNGFVNPFYRFYFKKQESNFVTIISDLSLIRAKIREHSSSIDSPIFLKQFLEVIQSYEKAKLKMVHTTTYSNGRGVELMTAHKSKGQEFEYVFLIGMVDEIWGSSQRSNRSKISLPINLQYITNQTGDDDEYLRLLYVALTRAKSNLILTSHKSKLGGKPTKDVKYLEHSGVVEDNSELSKTSEILPYWTRNHSNEIVNLKPLLSSKLDNYRMSPSHLNTFVDVVYAGPEAFFIDKILNFPSPSSIDMIYGNVVHATIEWMQKQLIENEKLPTKIESIKYFEFLLSRQLLQKDDYEILLERGKKCIEALHKQRSHTFSIHNLHEENFYGDGITLNEIVLTGKIDKLIIDRENKTITIVDFKTGKHEDKWKNTIKLHKYKQQMYLYKYLVEHSRRFSGYRVEEGYLEFVDPDSDGNINELHLTFDTNVETQIHSLAKVVWNKIMNLDFPSVEKFPQNMTGVILFEKELIEGD